MYSSGKYLAVLAKGNFEVDWTWKFSKIQSTIKIRVFSQKKNFYIISFAENELNMTFSKEEFTAGRREVVLNRSKLLNQSSLRSGFAIHKAPPNQTMSTC